VPCHKKETEPLLSYIKRMMKLYHTGGRIYVRVKCLKSTTYVETVFSSIRILQGLFPASCFSSYFTFLPLGDVSIYNEKMAAPGE